MSKPLFEVTVSDEGASAREYRFRVTLDACDDYIPLESQATREDADGMADDARTLIGALVSAAQSAERERCLDILMRVGISAMEAGHTHVGKYIAAASTKIRASK